MNKYNILLITDRIFVVNNSIDHYDFDNEIFHKRRFDNNYNYTGIYLIINKNGK